MDLTKVDFTGYSFSCEDLTGADFTGSSLDYCRFKNSICRDVNFSGSHMGLGIDFRGADLTGANFKDTFLHNAKFEGATGVFVLENTIKPDKTHYTWGKREKAMFFHAFRSSNGFNIHSDWYWDTLKNFKLYIRFSTHYTDCYNPQIEYLESLI
jgi:Pentapeptide repeats (8 copies)